MANLGRELYGKPHVYILDGARLDKVVKLMWENDCGGVPMVGFIEELGWFGPTVIGVVTDRDVAIASASRNNRPKNICSQSVMQRNIFNLYRDETSRSDLEGLYGAIVNHYKETHP